MARAFASVRNSAQSERQLPNFSRGDFDRLFGSDLLAADGAADAHDVRSRQHLEGRFFSSPVLGRPIVERDGPSSGGLVAVGNLDRNGGFLIGLSYCLDLVIQ